MPISVQHPTLGEIEFPDGMGQVEIASALKKIDAQNDYEGVKVDTNGRRAILPNPTFDGVEIPAAGAPTAARIGIPLAAAPLTGGASLLATAGVQAGASALGEMAGQFLEQGELKPGAILRAGATGAAGSVVPYSRLSGDEGTRSALSKAIGVLRSGFTNSALQAGTDMAAGAAGDAIDGTPQKTLAERGREAFIPAIVGFGFGTISRRGADIRQTDADRKVAVDVFGRQELPPEAIDLSFARAANNVTARTNRSGMDAIEEELANRYRASIGNPPEGAILSEQIAPYVGTLDDANTSLGRARIEADKANLTYKDAQDAYRVARERAESSVDGTLSKRLAELNEAQDAQMTANMGAIREEAYRIKQLKLTNDAYVDFPTLRNLYVEKVQKPLEALLKRKSDNLYEQIGVNPTEPLVDGSEIANAIDKSYRAGEASEDELKFITNRLLARISSGKNEEGEVVYKAISLNDARALRRELWDMRDNVPSGTTRADSLLSDVDNAIATSLKDSIQRVGGDEALTAYNAANEYWKGISQARQNPLARALMSRSPNDESVQTLVNKLVEKGPKADEKLGVDNYIRSVAEGEPAVMEEMKGHIMSLIRGGVVARNLEGDLVNVGKLATDVARLQRNGFPATSLNLGSADELRQIAALSSRAGLGSKLTKEELLQVIESPGVQDALLAGQDFSVAAAKPINELAAVNQTRLARYAEIAGLTEVARKNYAYAETNMKRAGMTVDNLNQRVQSLEGDPLMMAFSGGKNFGMSGKAQDDFNNFLTSILKSSSTTDNDVRQLMSAIEKKSPEMREFIAQRVIKDKLEWLATNARTGKENLDYKKVAAAARNDDESKRLRAVLGEERFNKLMEVMPQIDAIQKINRAGMAGSDAEIAAQTATTARSIINRSPTGGVAYVVRASAALVSRGQYKAASLIMSNPKVWSVYSKTGDLAAAIDSLGVQRAVMLYQNNPGLREEVEQNRRN